MFTIIKHDENGRLMEVATLYKREAAEQLMAWMQKLFPEDRHELRESSADEGAHPPRDGEIPRR